MLITTEALFAIGSSKWSLPSLFDHTVHNVGNYYSQYYLITAFVLSLM